MAAEDVFGRGVKERDILLFVHRDDGVLRAIDDRGEPGFGLGQLSFHAHLLEDAIDGFRQIFQIIGGFIDVIAHAGATPRSRSTLG